VKVVLAHFAASGAGMAGARSIPAATLFYWTRPLSVMATLFALSAVYAATVATAVVVAATDGHDDKR